MKEYRRYFRYSRKLSEIGEGFINDKPLSDRNKMAKISLLLEIQTFLNSEINRVSDGLPTEMIYMMKCIKIGEYPKFNKSEWEIFCDSIPSDDIELNKIKSRIRKIILDIDGKTNKFIMSRLYRNKISYYKRCIIIKSKKVK